MADKPTTDPGTDDQTSTPDPSGAASDATNQDTTTVPDGASADDTSKGTTTDPEVPEAPTADQQLQDLLAERKKTDNDMWSEIGRERSKTQEQLQAQRDRIDQLEAQVANSQPGPAPTADEYSIYDGIPGLDELPPAAAAVADRQHRAIQQTKAEMQAEMDAIKKELEEKERQRQQQEQISSQAYHYKTRYGMNDDEVNAMQQARNSGDHQTADRILLLSTQRQQQARKDAAAQAEQNQQTSFQVGGGSSNGNLSAAPSAQDAIQSEVDKINAMPDQEKNAYISDNFATYSPEMREALVRVK